MDLVEFRLPWFRAKISPFLVMGLLTLLPAARAAAVTELTRGAAAPEMALTDLDGRTVQSADWRGRCAILIFGELYHDPTITACRQVRQILDDPRLTGEAVSVMLIVAQDKPAKELKAQASEQTLAMTVLHDPRRQTFGAYHVAVMPSVVVLDAQGRVVHALAGLSSRFNDLLTDAVLLAAGKLSAEQFELTLHPEQAPPLDEPAMRADRLAQLARQLAQRNMQDLAVAKYREALKLAPDHAAAHLGLGRLMLRRQRLPEAEAHFRAVLAGDPKSIEGNLGLAYVQTLRGGEELLQAETVVRDVLSVNPSLARGHYLLGMIREQQRRYEDATVSYRKAAELLLERVEQEDQP